MDLEKWILFTYPIETDAKFIPEISINVTKENEKIDPIILKSKAFFIFGTLKSNDVLLAHPSISRVHAALVVTNK